MNIGTVVRKHRKEKGLSQPGLSALCGVSDTTIYTIEIGRFDGRISSLKLIAEGLQMPLWEIIKEAEECENEHRNSGEGTPRKEGS